MADYILNGQAHGDVASRLMQFGGDPGALRPWLGKDGKSRITVNQFNPRTGKVQPTNILTNAAATLTKDEWILLDEMVIRVAKQRLKAWDDLMSRGLRLDIPNGMSKTIIQYQNMTDISAATVSMDGLRQSDRDRPQFDLVNLPLPITHKDFSFSLREVLVSRQTANTLGSGNGGTSLDLATGELSARRVAEEVEKALLGTTTGYSYGGGTAYGYTNFPSRNTKTMTAPTGSNPNVTLNEVLDMRKKSQDDFHFGPWVLYTSLDWDVYLDNDYILSGGTSAYKTLRERLAQVNGIMDIVTLDYLPAKTMLLVQLSQNVVRGIIGMPLTTVDWESHGGMQLNFKIMTIMVPQLRTDTNGNTGIVHGTYP